MATTPTHNHQVTEPDFIIHKLERPQRGELLLVHEIGIEDLEKLAQGERRLSGDGDPEDAVLVYEAINQPRLQTLSFVCVTPYIESTIRAKPVNELFGRGSKIALIIDMSAVRERLLIFNGDVGRLGKALRSGEIQPSFIRSLHGSDPTTDLVSELRMFDENTRKVSLTPVEPRLHGNSFEGRVWDGISHTDISQVCIGNRDDKRAIEAARRIQALREADNKP